MTQPSPLQDCGFEMHDLLQSPEFTRRLTSDRTENCEQAALKQIAQKISSNPEVLLQELVNVAVEFCSADSAGISLEEPDGQGGLQFRWIAVAGSFGKYLNGTTPRKFSPCGVCLDEWRPQFYRVTKPYYDFLGVTADPILDGMLIPWESDRMRGTVWAVSHKSKTTFDLSDYGTLQRLADLVAVAIRQVQRSS